MFSEHSLEPFRHALYVQEDYMHLRSFLLTLLFSLCYGLSEDSEGNLPMLDVMWK